MCPGQWMFLLEDPLTTVSTESGWEADVTVGTSGRAETQSLILVLSFRELAWSMGGIFW